LKIPHFNNLNSRETGAVEVFKIENFCEPKFYESDLTDKKEYVNFIKNIEKIVRRSYEYKKYIRYLKNDLNIQKCTFLPNIDLKEVRGVGIEFHHYPLTLFDMTAMIVNDMIYRSNTEQVDFSPFLIANEVMKCHYENIVGLVPLSKTVHELAHSGSIFIPMNLTFGNVRAFIKRYKMGMTDEMKESLRTLIELTDRLGDNYEPEALEIKITRLEVEGQNEIRPILDNERELA
jgi:hypothetical protein